eukprot:scaffold15378_cov112-Isochrysis_galbana.AAC.2
MFGWETAVDAAAAAPGVLMASGSISVGSSLTMASAVAPSKLPRPATVSPHATGASSARAGASRPDFGEALSDRPVFAVSGRDKSRLAAGG